MKVNDERNSETKVKIADLDPGETFVYNGDHYSFVDITIERKEDDVFYNKLVAKVIV